MSGWESSSLYFSRGQSHFRRTKIGTVPHLFLVKRYGMQNTEGALTGGVHGVDSPHITVGLCSPQNGQWL